MENILPTNKIIGEAFFGKLPKDPLLLETDFVRLDKSIIWKMSDLFWKYYTLWEKTYNENFEASLPSGISESHKPEFIKESTERFLARVRILEKQGKLPSIIYVYEQGPGAGIFAKGFLDCLKKQSPEIYTHTIYLLSDSSQEILQTCIDVLTEHKNHVKLFMQDAFEDEKKFLGKILFARHSNIWDGWPCRCIQMRKSGLGEVYVRAVTSKQFGAVVETIQKKGLEYALIHNATAWKEFFRSITCETRTIPFSALDSKEDKYLQYLKINTRDHVGRNTLLSDLIIQNLSFLDRRIDWERGGYIEIVDIIAQQPKKTYPKKFDGSIGYIIDGGMVANWCKKMNKQHSFKQMRKLNTLLTISNSQKDLKEMVHDASLEIYPAKDLLKNVQSIKNGTTLAVTCTSKLGVIHTIEHTITLHQMGYAAYPHLPARLVQNEKDVKGIVNRLTTNNISDVFVAAGNAPTPLGAYESAMDLLGALKKADFPFGKVAVAGYPEGHPQISQKKLMQALQEKQEFAQKNTIDMKVVTQFCFDADTIVNWAIDIKKKGIHLPIVIGISGPFNMTKLLQFAVKCGVGNSLQFLKGNKHLPLQYNPEQLLRDIVNHPQFHKTHIVGFHFYTFNNVAQFALWQKDFLAHLSVANE